MTLEELGAALRQEREKRGLLVDDVADHLKIGARLLRALEEGDRASLPHLAYTRGFVRSYAAYLGMAADEVSAALSAMNEEREEEPVPVYARPRRPKGGSGKWLVVLTLLAGLAGLGYAANTLGWLDRILARSPRLAQPAPPLPGAENATVKHGGMPPVAKAAPDREETAGRHAVSEAESGAAGSAGEVSKNPVPAAEQDSATPRSANQTARKSADMPASNIGGTMHEERVGNQPSVLPGQAATPAEGALPAGQHRVVITAVEECWIHSNADNTDTRQFSLNKGDTFALTFARNLRIKLGNAGGVRIRYNGQEMPAAGTSGQVRTLTFPPVAQ